MAAQVSTKFTADTTIAQVLHLDKTVVGQSYSFLCSLTSFKVQGSGDQRRMFAHVSDGSGPTDLQIFYDGSDSQLPAGQLDSLIERGSPGASVRVTGVMRGSPGKSQSIEMYPTSIEIIDQIREADKFQYGAQARKKSVDYDAVLKGIRTDTTGRFRHPVLLSVLRIRSRLATALHTFFDSQGFFKIDTPLITASDCEGAGEMFKVTTLPIETPHTIPVQSDTASDAASDTASDTASGLIRISHTTDFTKDFFGKKVGLTVSGQLEAEALAKVLQKVYTFGPTFRAEHSITSRHLAEFWMLEPEVVFSDLDVEARFSRLKDLEESMVKYVIDYAFTHCMGDLQLLDSTLSPGLIERLQKIQSAQFVRLTYTDAIRILQEAVATGHIFEKSEIVWGMDLGSEHESYIVDQFGVPVFVTHYPQALKSFYMKADTGCEPDKQTVQATDLLVPGIGELCGGSMREDDPERLVHAMELKQIPVSDLQWYVDLRKDGGKPTGGFGLGFERLVRLITGAKHIFDVIPFPRQYQHI